MDKKRYEELFLDVERWVEQARRLKMGGDELSTPAQGALTATFVLRSELGKGFHRSMERMRALSDARAILYGLAIENAAKARLIKDGKISFSPEQGVKTGNGKYKPDNLPTHHNLLKIVTEAGYSPTESESEYLERLTYQLLVTSRYPVAKDLKAQKKLPGVSVGATASESAFVDKIIKAVLADEQLVILFQNGSSAQEEAN